MRINFSPWTENKLYFSVCEAWYVYVSNSVTVEKIHFQKMRQYSQMYHDGINKLLSCHVMLKKEYLFFEIHFMSPKCVVFQPWSLRTLIKFLYSRSHFSLSLLSHFCIYLTYPFYQRTAGLVSQNNQVLLDKITLHRQSK